MNIEIILDNPSYYSIRKIFLVYEYFLQILFYSILCYLHTDLIILSWKTYKLKKFNNSFDTLVLRMQDFDLFGKHAAILKSFLRNVP